MSEPYARDASWRDLAAIVAIGDDAVSTMVAPRQHWFAQCSSARPRLVGSAGEVMLGFACYQRLL